MSCVLQFPAPLLDDRPSGLQENPDEDDLGNQIRPSRTGPPYHQARTRHRQRLDQVVPGTEPDRTDVGVTVAITDQQQRRERIRREAEQAKTGDDFALGRGPGDSTPEGENQNAHGQKTEARALEEGRARSNAHGPADRPQADGVGCAVRQEVE